MPLKRHTASSITRASATACTATTGRSTGVNPTAENLARIIFEELEKSPVFVRDSHLAAITVYETPTSSVTYTRD